MVRKFYSSFLFESVILLKSSTIEFIIFQYLGISFLLPYYLYLNLYYLQKFYLFIFQPASSKPAIGSEVPAVLKIRSASLICRNASSFELLLRELKL